MADEGAPTDDTARPPSDGSAAPDGEVPTTALARRPTVEPRELRLARTLEEAGRGSFVHIDGRGEVRSPMRYRILTAIAHGTAVGLAVAATSLYVTVFGPAGAVFGFVFGGAYLLGQTRRRRWEHALQLIQEDRLDEAEALCRQTLSGRLVPRPLRAGTHHLLAAVAARRGDFETALTEVRRAIKLRHSWLRRHVYQDLLAYFEIELLVNLARVGEARARLDGRGAVPDGNYLRVLHWTVDLYVQFAEGRLALDEDALWERSQAALRITGAAQLLALCAWAYGERRDEDMAAHLLAEAVDRAEPGMERRVPSLWQWVEARKKPA